MVVSQPFGSPVFCTGPNVEATAHANPDSIRAEVTVSSNPKFLARYAQPYQNDLRLKVLEMLLKSGLVFGSQKAILNTQNLEVRDLLLEAIGSRLSHTGS